MTPSDNCKALQLMTDMHRETCALEDCAARPVRLLAHARALLEDLEDYLDRHADVDEPEPGRKVPNEEMQLLNRVRLLLIPRLTVPRLSLGHEYVPCPAPPGTCVADKLIGRSTCHHILGGPRLCAVAYDAH